MKDAPTALVTGGSSGIGAAIAKRLAADGHNIAVGYHTDEAGATSTAEACAAFGRDAYTVQADVRDEASVLSMTDSISSRSGRLDVLVHSAAVDIPKSIHDVTFEEWALVSRTKIDGTFLVTKHAIPLLQTQGGNIIYLTSHDGVRPDPSYPAYCVGTAAILALAHAMARDLPKVGIRVNCVSPGPVRTPLWRKIGDDSPETWASLARESPIGRVVTAEEVAEWVSVIATSSSQVLNGNVLYVNGGSHL